MPKTLVRASCLLAVVFLLARVPAPAAETPANEAAAPQPGATLAPQPGDDEITRQVKDLFQKALVHLEFRRFKEAAEELQKAIALKPNSLLVAQLYGQTITKFIDAGLKSKDPQLQDVAKRLQVIALKGRIEQLRTPEHIKKLVDDLEKGGFLERTLAMEELISAGDYAVPYVVKMIETTPTAERRAYGGYVLSRLHGTAVPAICQALKIEDPLVRQVLIQALEVIKDPRSIPWLLWLAQRPQANPLVAAAAQQALATMATDPATLQQSAAQAFLGLAEDYYNKDSRVLLPHLYEHLVWRYDTYTKTLNSESVPPFLYPYRMAEEMARDALMVNPSYEPAVPVLIDAYFAQQAEIEGFFKAVEGKELGEEVKKEVQLATPIRERLRVAPLVANAAGKKFVYAALGLAMRTGKPDVALACIQSLREIADGSALPKPPLPEGMEPKARRTPKPAAKPGRDLTWFGKEEEAAPEAPPPTENPYGVALDGSPLIQALSYPPDRRVRYAAAEAIVAISPRHMIRDADKVMAALSDALSETAYRVALVVDENPGTAEELRPLLQDVGVVPVLASNQRDALVRAAEVPPKDLLVLSAGLQQVGVVEMLASLRAIGKLASTPAIVVGTAAEITSLRVKLANQNVTFLPRPVVAANVRSVVDQVLASATEPKGQGAAVRYAADAARTLASLDPATSIFRLDDALPSMLRTVATRSQPDEVRIPCALAIRHSRNKRALPYLVETYNEPRSSKDLRLAALDALGACSASLETLPPDVADILVRASYDSDFDFRKSAALAFGLRGGVANADIMRIVDQLHGEKPRGEAPKIEAPKPEEPKPETPKIEAPAPEAPKAEAPKTEAPKPAPAPEIKAEEEEK